jgi:hypothetical protein
MLGKASLRIVLLATLSLAACRCDDSPPPTRKAETKAPREPKHEELLPQLPEPEGTIFDAKVLATALPAALGDAAAEGDATVESSALSNGGSTASASRTYVAVDHRITVQISDMQHAPLLREMMANARKRIEKQGASASWQVATVQGHETVVQYLSAQRTALANVIATDRLFVNVRVEPADDADIAIEWANKIPLEPITKLQAQETAPAQASQPRTPAPAK